MDRTQFTALRDLPGKRIDQDLVYDEDPAHAPLMRLRPVEVFNTGGVKVRLVGSYHPTLDRIGFTFHCKEAGGPICRVDVRGPNHKQAGRTHKHDLHRESDPANDLPTAVARPDLEALAIVAVWQDLCTRAQILHTGAFVDPRTPIAPIDE